MKKRVHIGVLVCTCAAIIGLSYNMNAASVCSETEIAGMSMMLDTYYNNSKDMALAEVSSDPESIVPVDEAPIPEESYAKYKYDTNTNTNTNTNNENDIYVEAGADGIAADESEVVNTEEVSGDALTVEPVVTPEPVSAFANVGISIANEYVNIRKKPNTDSKILGKLYRGSAASIVATEGDWVQIKSGSVTGYIKSEYLAIGFDAEKLIGKYGTKLATVTTETLKVREECNTECTVLTLVAEDETFEVVKELDEWVKIIVDEGTKGYVAKEYVTIEVEFKEAISIEEEQAAIRAKEERERKAREAEEAARLAREEAARQEAARQEAARQEAARRAAASKGSSSANKSSSGSSNKSSGSSSSSSSSSSRSSSGSSSSGSKPSSASGTGASAASYAQNFIGNKYVYGGTSLTNGTDCSGFVQSVYSKYGVSLPRTSSSQSNAGSSVSLDNVQAGDLIFYSSGGSVNHVAMYIGDGKVVHASNKRDGIKISNINYRTPCKARRVAN